MILRTFQNQILLNLKLIDSDFKNIKVYSNLANIYARTDFLESAIDTLEKAIANKISGYETINEELAKLYIKANDAEKAM